MTTASPSPTPTVKALNCPNCGGPLAVRGFAHTLNIACPSCLAILDAKDANFQVIQQQQVQQRIEPRIPLGTRGIISGAPYEVIGFQERTLWVESVAYSWYEYLLFNPYLGFRYVTEYRGHWNNVTTVHALPMEEPGQKPAARYNNERFRHFQTAVATTTYIIGEFPWQVRGGDKATCLDFISPPRMLSKEMTQEETTWSLGEYMTGKQVWEAFKLPGQPPQPEGVFANQPSPLVGSAGKAWKRVLLALAVWFVMMVGVLVLAGNQQVFDRSYSFSPRTGGEPSFVTETFELKGRPSTVEVSVKTDLANNWVFFRFALINADTGDAFDFAREVSYYSGVDGGESWSEGGRGDSVLIPSVPAGKYYLRVEPEMDANASAVRYDLAVKRDVPSMVFFWLALPLLIVPALIPTFRSWGFETARWAESDYAGGSDSDSDSDD